MRALFFPTVTADAPKRGYNLMLRQGLPPIEDPTLDVNYRFISNVSKYDLKISPDQTKGIWSQSYNGTNFTYHFIIGPSGWTTDTNAAAAFSGAVLDNFTSNDYYGFVGASTSFINAYKWSDHSFVTLNKTGLGTVYRASIHPINGYLLAVTHNTSPYLRIYDLRDGTYIQPATPLPSTTNSVCWSGNGSFVVCVSDASPFVSKYDAALTTRTTISTSGFYRVSNSYTPSDIYSWGGYSMPHPTKPDCAIMTGNYPQSGYKMLFEVNTATNAITDILTASATETVVFGFGLDVVGNSIYTFTNTTATGTKTFKAYDLTTYAAKTDQNLPIPYGAINDGRPMVVVNKNYGQITGTVRDVANNPAARVIRAYRRSDGLLVGQTTSNGTTGDYSLLVPTSDVEAYDLQFMTAGGELLNDLIYARTTPAAIP